jgi:hypothetical protein
MFVFRVYLFCFRNWICVRCNVLYCTVM